MKVYTNERNEIVSVKYREDLTEVEIPAENPEDFFYGKCRAYITGFRAGMEECGEEEDGTPIMGFVIAPYKDLSALEMAQQQYEQYLELLDEKTSGSSGEVIATVAQFSAMNFTDAQALAVKEIYPKWSELGDGTQFVKQEDATNGTEITKVLGDDGTLYKVRTTHVKQADWIPGIETASLFEAIDEQHAGTIDDPIPYNRNMELFSGKYYTQDGVAYKCIRDTEQPVYHALADLVGIYVECVE